MSDLPPDNIIDLLPFLEGQKYGWTVDMTRAILQHGREETNRCLTHARESTPINPYTGEVSALACMKTAVFPPGMGSKL